jgi:hypothetical protein
MPFLPVIQTIWEYTTVRDAISSSQPHPQSSKFTQPAAVLTNIAPSTITPLVATTSYTRTLHRLNKDHTSHRHSFLTLTVHIAGLPKKLQVLGDLGSRADRVDRVAYRGQ